MRNEGAESKESGNAATEQFGAYLVFEQLGQGGMATVHRAKKLGIEGFELEVALKRILPHLSKNGEFVRWFAHEAKLASLLVHPNIARTYDFGRVDDVYFIAMEHVAGVDLSRLLRYCHKQQVVPPLSVVLSLLLELCEALEYAHTLADASGQPYGITHRDISLSNLVVANTGHLKVIDFGIAKALSLDPEDGHLKGKFAYMAPEAVEGRPVGPSFDVFSVGVVAHELLTVKRLFHAPTDEEVLSRVRHGKIPPPSRRNRSVPVSLDRLVLAALERDERRRLQSAGEFRRALAAVAIEAGIHVSARDVAEWWAAGGAHYEQGASREAPSSSSRNSARGLPRLELSGSQQQEPSSGTSAGSDAQRLGSVDRRPGTRQAPVSAPKIASAPERVLSRARAGLILAGLFAMTGGVAAYQLLARPTPAVAPPLSTTAAEQPQPASVKFVLQPPDAVVQVGEKTYSRQSPFELDLEPGVYSVTVSRPGYERWRSQLTLQAGESKTISVVLEPAGAIVAGSSEPAKADSRALNRIKPAEVTVSPGSHRPPTGKRSSGTAATEVARTASPAPERTMQRASSGSTARTPVAREPVVQLEDRSSEPAPEPATVKPPSRPELTPAAPTAVATAPAPPAVPPRARSAPPPVVPANVIAKLSGELPAIQRGGPANVLSKICIGTDGRVTTVKVIRASPGIAAAIERSLMSWRYKPYVDDAGQPSPACFAISLRFERADGR